MGTEECGVRKTKGKTGARQLDGLNAWRKNTVRMKRSKTNNQTNQAKTVVMLSGNEVIQFFAVVWKLTIHIATFGPQILC
jgi:hypothetical protein